MMVDYYSVPSDFKKETIDKLSVLNKKYKNKKRIVASIVSNIL